MHRTKTASVLRYRCVANTLFRVKKKEKYVPYVYLQLEIPNVDYRRIHSKHQKSNTTLFHMHVINHMHRAAFCAPTYLLCVRYWKLHNWKRIQNKAPIGCNATEYYLTGATDNFRLL